MNDRLTGIILRQEDYKERAALVTVLTREYGRLTLLANGVRKVNSRNAGSLFPYTKGEFILDYKKDKTFFTLHGVHTVAFYRRLHTDIEAQSAAACAGELAFVLSSEGGGQIYIQTLYDALESLLTMLEEAKRYDLVFALFLAEILRLLGIAPEVDACVISGSKQVAAISVREGGFVHADYIKETDAVRYDTAHLRQFRLVNKARFADYDRITDLLPSCAWIVRLLIAFLQAHADLSLRSFRMLEQMLEEK